MLFSSWEFGLFLLVAGGCAAGFTAALLRSWAINSRLIALEAALGVVEGTLQREVKARAGMIRQQKRDPLEDQIVEAIANPPKPQQPYFWWKKYTDQKNTKAS